METVRMVREEPQAPGGPTTADVHPEEVENYRRHGWREAQVEKTETPDPEKEALVAEAAELKIESPSNLKRWGKERLKTEIEKAKAASAEGGDGAGAGQTTGQES